MLNVLSRIVFAVILVLSGSFQVAEAGGGGGRARGQAAVDFGIIVDIQGNAQMKPVTGEPIILDRKNDLLRTTVTGDKLRVLDEGRIVVLSFWDRKLYEIPAGTLVQVDDTSLIPVRGMFKTLSNATVLPEDRKQLFTVWTPRRLPCVRAVSPIDTSVLSLTPRLEWELNCDSVDNLVTIRIISGDEVIYELQTGETSFKVPKGILKGSNTYQWTVDAGRDGIFGATFSTLSESETKHVLERRTQYSRNTDHIPTRIAFILFLKTKNLTEMARDEIVKLKADFPDNPHIEVFAQEEPDLGADDDPPPAEESASPAPQPDAPETDAATEASEAPADVSAAEETAAPAEAGSAEVPSP